ncbi:hypothetical protein Tco_0880785, partial [Tanacetum coccineum]
MYRGFDATVEALFFDEKSNRRVDACEEMAKYYQIETVLYEVLKTVVPPSKVEGETIRYAKNVEEKKEQYEQ